MVEHPKISQNNICFEEGNTNQVCFTSYFLRKLPYENCHDSAAKLLPLQARSGPILTPFKSWTAECAGCVWVEIHNQSKCVDTVHVSLNGDFSNGVWFYSDKDWKEIWRNHTKPLCSHETNHPCQQSLTRRKSHLGQNVQLSKWVGNWKVYISAQKGNECTAVPWSNTSSNARLQLLHANDCKIL